MSFKTIRCPKCGQLLEIPQPAAGVGSDSPPQPLSVSCPSCGTVRIEGELDPTILYRRKSESRAQTQVGHFRLSRMLGQGSAGEVWLAEDIHLGRQVALKLPRSQDQETMSLLLEAKTSASLRHPNMRSVRSYNTREARVRSCCHKTCFRHSPGCAISR